MRALRRLHEPVGLSYLLCVSHDNRDPYHDMVARGGPSNSIVDTLLLLMKPGDLVLDIGANIGVLTIPLAVAGARVIAYEPHPGNFPFLEAAIRLNGVGSRVTVRRAAAWDAATDLALGKDSAWAHVDPGGSVTVKAVAIDEDLPEDADVGLVKVDVEGSELRALSGMRRMLARRHPHIVYESNIGELGHLDTSAAELERFVVSLGYRIYRVYSPKRLLTPGRLPQEISVVDYLATVWPPRRLRAAGFRVGRMGSRHIIRSVRRFEPDPERLADRIHLATIADRLPWLCRRDPAVAAAIAIGRGYANHPVAVDIRRGAEP